MFSTLAARRQKALLLQEVSCLLFAVSILISNPINNKNKCQERRQIISCFCFWNLQCNQHLSALFTIKGWKEDLLWYVIRTLLNSYRFQWFLQLLVFLGRSCAPKNLLRRITNMSTVVIMFILITVGGYIYDLGCIPLEIDPLNDFYNSTININDWQFCSFWLDVKRLGLNDNFSCVVFVDSF